MQMRAWTGSESGGFRLCSSGRNRPGLRGNLIPRLSAVQDTKTLCDPDQSVVQYGSRNSKSSVAGQRYHRIVRAEDIADEITRAQSLGPAFDNADQPRP